MTVRTSITPKQQAMIDEIMDWFDFDRVHDAMEALGWTWFGCSDDGQHDAVPNVPQLRERARSLLKAAVLQQQGQMTSGFRIHYHGEPDGFESLRMFFYIADWETDTESNVDPE